MSVSIISAAFNGIEGYMVEVEVEISRGLPAFNIVGLGDTSVKESKERVRAAITNSDFDFPLGRITVNLAPADLRKEGSIFELPIAIGILIASLQLDVGDISKFMIVGELSLSGKINGIKGALTIAIEGSNRGIKDFIIPLKNYNECSLLENINIYPLESLKQLANFLQYRDLKPMFCKWKEKAFSYNVDFNEVCGQESAKRAIEVAAAGGHNLILFGPAGSGKSMLAQRIPTILPKLSYEEALEVTKIYSVSGKLSYEDGVVFNRPFRNPHHTITQAALVGGGKKVMPGEISLAHNGVLFLDEILEFKKGILELLRQPLEEKCITITRAAGSVNYPANFMLIGAMNPCPCGFYGSSLKQCTCTDYERRRYVNKLSGPFLDRMDLFISVNALRYEEIENKNHRDSSENIRNRVENARHIQKERFKDEKIFCNAQMNSKLINKYCILDIESRKFMKNIYNKFYFSARAYNRMLKLGKTIADLKGNEEIHKEDLIEAFNYRKFINEEII